jgi:hypothetical protein
LVNLYYTVDHYEGAGSNSSSVTLTAGTDGSVAGTIDYADTASDGQPLALSGDFEVIRCPQ